jgi:hypothetical protein
MWELFIILLMALASSPVSFFNCCCCACSPETSFQVDIAGVANDGFCTVCSNFDGTYFLTPTGTNCLGASGFTCLWQYTNLTMGDPCGRACGAPNGICVRLIQTLTGGGDSICTVTVQAKGFVFGFGNCGFEKANQPNGVFVKNFGAPATCADYVALDVPYDHADTTAVNCDFTAATCTVTAI